MQVSEHAALGAMPEHDIGAVHASVEAAKKQPSASFAQVASVWASWHRVPVCMHALAVHVQEAVPPSALAPVHVSWVPHVAVVTHCVQPSA